MNATSVTRALALGGVFLSFGCGGGSSGAGGSATTGTMSTGTMSTSSGSAGGTILFDVSGEVLALGGYAYPPANAGDPAFADGWDVQFSEFLVTVDKIKINENPDTNAGDQSQVGKLIAEVDGPWVVDLHKGGPLPGKGGAGEQAVQLATLDNQNMNGGAAFDADSRYAFGFDIVNPTANAKNVNLDAQGMADYQLMQQKGYVVLYVGTATWKGDTAGPLCTTGKPGDPEFTKFPTVVNFKLGFKSPTTYINCQNPDNDPAKPLGTEEHQRGIIVKSNQQVIGQLTVHTDHPFWESFVHDSPAHFDMIAAQHTGEGMTVSATEEDVIGVDPTAITDKQKNAVPWRGCVMGYAPPTTGQMSFDPLMIPVVPGGDPTKDIRDLYDYMTYNQSTQGHLNSDGLCFVQRHYPSPP